MNVKAKIKVREQVQVQVQLGRGEVEVEGEVEDEDEDEDEDKRVDSAGEVQESRSGHREAVIILIRGSARTALSRPGKETMIRVSVYVFWIQTSTFTINLSSYPNLKMSCDTIYDHHLQLQNIDQMRKCGNAEMQSSNLVLRSPCFEKLKTPHE